jgi:hypothetical protein
MFVTYPKSKKKPAPEQKPRAEETDSVYHARPRLGKSDDTRMRNLQLSDYGKQPQNRDDFDGGIRVNPGRTMRLPL